MEEQVEEQSVYVYGDSEIARFKNAYETLINKACASAGLPACDRDIVLNNMLLKFAKGQLDFDAGKSKGAKYSTFLYGVALNCAKDEIQRRRLVNIDTTDKAWQNLRDERSVRSRMATTDEKFFVTEALKRLVAEMHDKTKAEILVRFAINAENREDVARAYRVSPDFVSLVKTRYITLLQKFVREVMKEDETGRLKLSDTDIRFLRPYIKNW